MHVPLLFAGACEMNGVLHDWRPMLDPRCDKSKVRANIEAPRVGFVRRNRPLWQILRRISRGPRPRATLACESKCGSGYGALVFARAEQITTPLGQVRGELLDMSCALRVCQPHTTKNRHGRNMPTYNAERPPGEQTKHNGLGDTDGWGLPIQSTHLRWFCTIQAGADQIRDFHGWPNIGKHFLFLGYQGIESIVTLGAPPPKPKLMLSPDSRGRTSDAPEGLEVEARHRETHGETRGFLRPPCARN